MDRDREQAFIANARSAGDAIKRAAATRGVEIPDWAADFIAAAALAYGDDLVTSRHMADRLRWEDEGYRDYTRQKMRHDLLDTVTRQGHVPSSLPRETIRYMAGSFLDPERCSEIPEEAVAQGANWETVEVTLQVRTRRPPVDREKAVKAGVLSG